MMDVSERYSRQILFPGISRDGQARLVAGRVLIVGAGALGAAQAEALVRAGVGFVRIVDRDFVEFSNLQRQSLYDEEDAAQRLPKAIAARERLALINSAVTIEAIVADVNYSTISGLLENIDLVIDGTDNFEVRYLVNDACVKAGVPWIYGAAVSSYGTSMTILPGETPCLRCIFDEIPAAGTTPTCDTAGVIQPIIAMISAIQTTEALKILTGQKSLLHGSLIQIDVWQTDFRRIKPGPPDPACECCGHRRFVFLDAERAGFEAVLCGRNAVQIAPPNAGHLDLAAFGARVSETSAAANLKINEYLVRFDHEELEITVFADARMIVKGSDDVARARSVYAKLIGN